jgi:hypothetical protein
MLAVEALLAESTAVAGHESYVRVLFSGMRSVHGKTIRAYIISFRAG